MILGINGIIAGKKQKDFNPILDIYSGSTLAFSLRKMRSSYNGYAIRVRRSSDNNSLDIGFTSNGYLDTGTLSSFVGNSNGYVSIWYDQSGNGNNANQTTTVNQPQIVNSGTLILSNGNPSVYFNSSSQSVLVLTTSFTAGTSIFNCFVGNRINTNDKLIGLSGLNSGTNYLLALWSDNKYYLQAKTNVYQQSNSDDLTNSQLLISGINSNGTMSLSKNGANIPSATYASTISTTINCIGKYSLSNYTNGYLQEVIFYNIDNSSNKNGIESNINSFYSIY